VHILLSLLLLANAPFWETKPPGQWTDDELAATFQSSPWVKMIEPPMKAGSAPAILSYLATARPMRDAERENRRRKELRQPSETPPDAEYEAFLGENEGKYIVLAVLIPARAPLADPREVKRMEEESFLRVDRKKYKMTGHFPPEPSDPYLRLVFPRAIEPGTKTFVFDLYLPSVPIPYRQIEFWVKDLFYKGKPEM
jgi:hypothetical protein